MYKYIYKILLFLDSFGIFIKIPSVEQKVQLIFNKIIDNEYYAADPTKPLSSRYMCYSLTDSAALGVITNQEGNFAVLEIKRYLGGETGFLWVRLQELDQPYKPKDCLDTYRNWSSRPFKKVK